MNPDRNEMARQMRADGWSYPEIARTLEASRSTIWRVLNPELAHARDTSPQRKAAKREWARTYARGACEICGAPTWQPAVRCKNHRAQIFAADARRAEIARRWRSGESMPEIAEAVGTTVNALGVTMVKMRKRGWDLPYRYRVDGAGKRLAA